MAERFVSGGGEPPSSELKSNHLMGAAAHFSDKEDAFDSSGKKKNMPPPAAVPQVTKPTSIEDFEVQTKLGTFLISLIFLQAMAHIAVCTGQRELQMGRNMH
jgi:hypothetical protein